MADWLQQLFGVITMYKIDSEIEELNQATIDAGELQYPECGDSIQRDEFENSSHRGHNCREKI